MCKNLKFAFRHPITLSSDARHLLYTVCAANDKENLFKKNSAEEAIERTTYTTILALPWFWQFWNGALIVVILNPLMCPLMPLGWLWRASKFIKVSFCLERMNYWKGDFYVLYCPNQNVLYKSPLVFILFIEVNRKRNKRRLYKQSEPLLTILKGLNLTYTSLKTCKI